jgi:hypothetical protein
LAGKYDVCAVGIIFSHLHCENSTRETKGMDCENDVKMLNQKLGSDVEDGRKI